MDIQNIIEKYNLTPSEANVLQYMSDNPNKNMRIRDLAEATFVSTAAIINMAKKMNLSGYSELLFYFERSKIEFEENQLHKVVELYGQSFYEVLKKYQDKQIVVVGNGYSRNIANYMTDFFNLYGFRATANIHSELLRKQYSGEALIIFISNSGNTVELLKFVEIACQNKIEYILFTGNHLARIKENAIFNICTDTYSVFRYTDYKPQLFFGSILIHFELLMAYVLRKLRK